MKNGFIANSYDDVVKKIVRILKNDSDLFTSCSKSVVNLANRFDWTETIKIWEKEIENIVNA